MIKLKPLLREDIIVASYPRDHIKYVLGIDVPLNESIAISPELYSTILTEQEIYENFIEASKEWLKKKYKIGKDKVVGKIDQYTDLIRIITRAIANPTLIVDFSVAFMKDIADKVVNAFLKIIEKLSKVPALKKLGKFFQKIINLVKQGWVWITKQTSWQKLIMAIGLGAIIMKLKGIFQKGVDWFKKFTTGELDIQDTMEELFPEIGDFSLSAIKSTIGKTIKAAVGPTITAIGGVIGSVDDVISMLDPTLDEFEEKTREDTT